MPIRPFKSRPSGRFLLGLGLITAGFTSFVGLSDELTARQARLNGELPVQLTSNASPDYYAAIAEKAVATGPDHYALAKEASLRALALNKNDVSAWNRLVWLDVASQGQLTQEGLVALYKSYEVSPYGDLSMMIWRTDLATRLWPALPDDLRAATLRQIPVIGQFGASWQWRINNCKYNPYKVIYQTVCKVSPDVARPGQTPPDNQPKNRP